MTADLAEVVSRIGALLESARTVGADPPTWLEVERLLTDGYACAHSLEADRYRMARQIPELGRDIDRLRSLLAELRDYGRTLPGPSRPQKSEHEAHA